MLASSQFISLYKLHQFILGRPPSINTFTDRLVAQKIGYLCSQLGIYLGELTFTWNWYKRGPYSPSFTSVLYEIKSITDSELESISRRYILFEEARNKLGPLMELISLQPEHLTEAGWLELAASIVYIYREESPQRHDVERILLTRKPQYSSCDFSTAWDVLSQLRFIEGKEDKFFKVV